MIQYTILRYLKKNSFSNNVQNTFNQSSACTTVIADFVAESSRSSKRLSEGSFSPKNIGNNNLMMAAN